MKADIAYKGALDICNTHAERLNWAMTELKPHFPLSPAKLAQLTPLELAIFDQFIVRFSKLQDAMGAKLLPSAQRRYILLKSQPFFRRYWLA